MEDTKLNSKILQSTIVTQTIGKKAQEALYTQMTIKSIDSSPYILIPQLFFISNMLFYKPKLFFCLRYNLLNTQIQYQARSLPSD